VLLPPRPFEEAVGEHTGIVEPYQDALGNIQRDMDAAVIQLELEPGGFLAGDDELAEALSRVGGGQWGNSATAAAAKHSCKHLACLQQGAAKSTHFANDTAVIELVANTRSSLPQCGQTLEKVKAAKGFVLLRRGRRRLGGATPHRLSPN
jgi:hypothetical protein